MEQAVVLCSGGLNSAVMTALAAQDYELAMLHVRFPHRAAEREAELFDALAEHFAPAQKLMLDMPHVGTVTRSVRLDASKPIPAFASPPGTQAATDLPGLNGMLLQTAYAWANMLGATRVFIGTSENLGAPGPRTASVWPEHSREYVFLMNQLLSVAGADASVTIEAPLIDLNRKEIVQMGQRLAAPFDRTWSCLDGLDAPCGRCLGCATRARGFLDAMMIDPLAANAAAAV